MMQGDVPYDVTLQANLRHEKINLVGSLKGMCQTALCNSESPQVILENDSKDTDNYTEGLRQSIEQHKNSLLFDSNKNLTELICNLQKRIKETKEFTAFKKAILEKTNKEIQFYAEHISTGEEALRLDEQRERTQPKDVSQQQINRAKAKFKSMKEDLHRLIETFYPDLNDELTDLLGDLCNKKLTENEYTEVKQYDYRAVLMLEHCGIISHHPYDYQKIRIKF